MLILSVDTALRNCNIVLARKAEILQEVVLGDEARHSSRVLEAVAALIVKEGMALNDLDGLAVTVGPGSFTGLRIGISTVKGLAFSLNKPVAGICVLEALARQAETACNIPIMALIDGSKQEVFVRKYAVEEFGLVPISAYQNLPYLEAARAINTKTALIGNGAALIEPFLTDTARDLALICPKESWVLQNKTLAALAYQKFAAELTLNGGAVVPNYIRKSDAEISRLP